MRNWKTGYIPLANKVNAKTATDRPISFVNKFQKIIRPVPKIKYTLHSAACCLYYSSKITIRYIVPKYTFIEDQKYSL